MWTMNEQHLKIETDCLISGHKWSFSRKLLTLRSLLNKLACLTVFSTVKQASLFNRDLRVLYLLCNEVEQSLRWHFISYKSVWLCFNKNNYSVQKERRLRHQHLWLVFGYSSVQLLTILGDLRGINDFCLSLHVVMQDDQSAPTSDQTNRQSSSFLDAIWQNWPKRKRERRPGHQRLWLGFG